MSTEEATETHSIQNIQGCPDLLPQDLDYFTMIKKVVRHRGRQAGFRRISTPLIEEEKLFQVMRISNPHALNIKLGSSAGILKSEETPGIIRSYLNHTMNDLPQPVQLYYIEPQIRASSKYSITQTHQFGFEVIGEKDPSIDAQLIAMSYTILKDLKIAHHFSLKINTLGNSKVQKEYNEALKNYFYGKERHLPPECIDLLETNPLRIFESKDEDVQILVSLAPKLEDFLDQESKEYYEEVKEFLVELNIPFKEQKTLIGKREYSQDIVFEFWDKNKGSGGVIGGGSRYDHVLEKLNAEFPYGAGCYFDISPLVEHLQAEHITPPQKDKMHVFMAQLGGSAKKKAMRLLSELHDRGVHAIGAVGQASMKDQLALADKFEVDWALLLGEVEVRENVVILRNMKAGTQETISLDTVVETIVEKVGKRNLDFYHLGE